MTAPIPWVLSNDAATKGWGWALHRPDGYLVAFGWWSRPSGAAGTRRRWEHFAAALPPMLAKVREEVPDGDPVLVAIEVPQTRHSGASNAKSARSLAIFVGAVVGAMLGAGLNVVQLVELTTGKRPRSFDWRPWVGIGSCPRGIKGDDRRAWYKAAAIGLVRERKRHRGMLDQVPPKGRDDAAEAICQGRATRLMWQAGLVQRETRPITSRMLVIDSAGAPERK